MLKGILKMVPGIDDQTMNMIMAFLDGSPDQKRDVFATIAKKIVDKANEQFTECEPLEGEDPVRHLLVTQLPDGRRVVAAVFVNQNTIRVAKSLTIEQIMSAIPDEQLLKLK